MVFKIGQRIILLNALRITYDHLFLTKGYGFMNECVFFLLLFSFLESPIVSSFKRICLIKGTLPARANSIQF